MASLGTFLLLTVSSPLVLGKPQYGAAPPVQTPVSAPVVQAPSQISCFTTQETIWDTQYIEKTEKECHQEQIQKFRQACQTVYKNSCQTVNKQVCSQQYRQESQPYTETECSSQQKTDCESRWEEDGYGGKKWVEVPSTCQQNTYDTCRDVQKQKLVQVNRDVFPAAIVVFTDVLVSAVTFFSSRFPTPTARMCLSSSARRCQSSNASRNPTQPPSRSDPH